MTIKRYTIPVFIPGLACPFRCVFCNQYKITGKISIPDEDQIRGTIEAHLLSFRKEERHVEIGFFGGSFTGIPPGQQARFLELVQPYLDSGQVTGIRLSTRPDYITDEKLELLARYRVTTIELGAQSMDDEVLKLSRRGHTAAQTETASQIIRSAGFDLGLQMMIGLPGDSLEKSLHTAVRIVELGASSTRIYPALVIRDTILHKWSREGKYTPLSIEMAVDWAKQLMLWFEKAGVTILRVGLHPSEGLLDGSELVAGPFHPSFRELVLTAIWSDLFGALKQLPEGKNIELTVPSREVNYAAGYGGRNRDMLMKHFRNVRFTADTSITRRDRFRYRLYA